MADRLELMRAPRIRGLMIPILAFGMVACDPQQADLEPAAPVILVGIDGASWNAIESLWEQGQLPNIRALAAGGCNGRDQTGSGGFTGIWTSIATGVRPERHGITGFVVPTPTGDVPVSSEVRRVPALWNMLSTVHRQVAVLGWWASWPAEPINGIMVSDRATRSLENAYWPPEFGVTFEEIVARDKQTRSVASHSSIARQDRASAAVAIDLASQRFDLLLVYLRNVDAESHPNWKYFRPDDFEQVDPEQLAKLGQRVPEADAAVDRALRELRALGYLD